MVEYCTGYQALQSASLFYLGVSEVNTHTTTCIVLLCIKVSVVPISQCYAYMSHCSGSTEATEILIDAGADVNAKGCNGNTPLILAANRGHTSIIRLLLRHQNIRINEVVCVNVYFT